ncbi:ergothioneine biosynthesis protein EgtC [Saccharopolyspora griseoalba]|uniref:Gamma-glutamyl-hercynylcysteine sulfoxide hydrolase n=1 Tax=Saccharopolyspora griseoalba TaxID=1431848 RepID=A0ABW2LCB5_9PSEU
MCRHLGYLGPERTLAELLLDPAHSLLEQSWDPTDMRGGGTVNADGFGAGWFGDDGEPATYRAAVPMWTDTSFPQVARQVRASAVVAAVRSATVGMPVSVEACAPLADGQRLFSHNGKVGGWPDSLAKLAGRLETTDLLTTAPIDSAVLWALLRQRLDAGEDPPSAVRDLVGEVLAAAPDSRLNLLLCDGGQLVATTWTHSLWVRKGPGSVAVASEPYGAPERWVEVPDRCLLVADTEHTEVTSLEEEA